MKPPSPPTPPPDPLLEAQRARAEADNIAALQVEAQGDTASLMARYGTRLALSGAVAGTPLLQPPASTPTPTSLSVINALGAMAGVKS